MVLIMKSYKFFIKHLLKSGFKEIGSGSFRRAFTRGNIVIKVPLNEDGIIDNVVESKAWKTWRNGPATVHKFYLAPCRLLPNHALMMVKVDEECVDLEKWYRSLPDWINKIDNLQVGFYKERFVAYDYALGIL